MKERKRLNSKKNTKNIPNSNNWKKKKVQLLYGMQRSNTRVSYLSETYRSSNEYVGLRRRKSYPEDFTLKVYGFETKISRISKNKEGWISFLVKPFSFSDLQKQACSSEIFSRPSPNI